ncbi:hypothetical protein BH23BAC4_BH23BAC4_16350 [soil metagenome]
MPIRHFLLLALPALLLLPGASAPTAALWGADGHRMIGQVAAETLPADMPAFFRGAAAQLSYLNPEPDRWRSRDERDLDPAMDNAHTAEHYINFERLPEGALLAPHRFAYLDSLREAGIETPGPGLLPYRILEMTQRMRVAFRQWRAEQDPEVRAFIEARIINDAGILGHYVADGSNPHHTTIHFNGWAGDNPHGYTTERTFHSRFESVYVRHNVTTDHLRGAALAPTQTFDDLRPAIWSFLETSNSYVERLYQLDQIESYGEHTEGQLHHVFAVERLAAGAHMLRDLWYTAWVTSG